MRHTGAGCLHTKAHGNWQQTKAEVKAEVLLCPQRRRAADSRQRCYTLTKAFKRRTLRRRLTSGCRGKKEGKDCGQSVNHHSPFPYTRTHTSSLLKISIHSTRSFPYPNLSLSFTHTHTHTPTHTHTLTHTFSLYPPLFSSPFSPPSPSLLPLSLALPAMAAPAAKRARVASGSAASEAEGGDGDGGPRGELSCRHAYGVQPQGNAFTAPRSAALRRTLGLGSLAALDDETLLLVGAGGGGGGDIGTRRAEGHVED